MPGFGEDLADQRWPPAGGFNQGPTDISGPLSLFSFFSFLKKKKNRREESKYRKKVVVTREKQINH